MIRPVFILALTAAMAAAPFNGRAQAPSGETSTVGSAPIKDELTPEVRSRVKKGLDYLAKNLNADGSVNAGGGDSAAVMALAGIAFVADGSLPNDGPYGKEVDKILQFTLNNCQPSGLIASQNYGSPMYGHGFASLFLAEVYGMSQRADVKEKLQNAIRLIVNSQNIEGGWRYQPVPQDADISVTICQVMALRAARNAGIKVPKRTIDRAIDYVKKSQEPDGGFAYMLAARGSAFPRSAAGVACLFYTGQYDSPEIPKGVKYLMQRLPGKSENSADYHFFYGNYYATQAMFMSGGDSWSQYWPAIRAELSKRQQADGSWSDQTGNVYGTAMALIILQVPNRLLPILQK
jgi:Prenyltransferase and squalene oxidase repeat